MTSFSELGVRPRTLTALTAQGILAPLPVQEQAIAPLTTGRDAVVEAPTGSGKTLAFLIPLIERLAAHRGDGSRALIVGPTRELASQTAAVLAGMDSGLQVALLFGGVGYGTQLNALRRAPDVVIGCPGRILDLAARGDLRLDRISLLILDEADEMLDQGFARDVERIIALTPSRGRQTVLASATMPEWVTSMIARHCTDPVRIRVQRESEPQLEHALLRVEQPDRTATLSALLRVHGGSAIVFHRTKHGAKRLARDLERLGHRSAELQGNLSQNARDRAITSFRDRRTDVLVATNVAARGIDVDHVELVVNFELPDTPEWLTHRIGRTARNGATGRALTLVGTADVEQWRKLRRLGAPALPQGDLQHLVTTGDLRLLTDPALPEADTRPVGARSVPRRPGFARPGAGGGQGASGRRPTQPSPQARGTVPDRAAGRRGGGGGRGANNHGPNRAGSGGGPGRGSGAGEGARPGINPAA